MEWVRSRVFECAVLNPGGAAKCHCHLRQRSDGVMFYCNFTSKEDGFAFEKKEVEKQYAKWLTEETKVKPTDEKGFNETFEMNMAKHQGVELNLEDLWQTNNR